MASSDTHPLRIFIIENHSDTLESLVMYLEALGHSVTMARSLKEALALLRSIELDVLLSDIGLPDGDGWELLRQANLPKSVYPIAMSGFVMGSDHRKSKAAGYRRHLVKPFDPLELDSALEEAAAELETAARAH